MHRRAIKIMRRLQVENKANEESLRELVNFSMVGRQMPWPVFNLPA